MVGDQPYMMANNGLSQWGFAIRDWTSSLIVLSDYFVSHLVTWNCFHFPLSPVWIVKDLELFISIIKSHFLERILPVSKSSKKSLFWIRWKQFRFLHCTSPSLKQMLVPLWLSLFLSQASRCSRAWCLGWSTNVCILWFSYWWDLLPFLACSCLGACPSSPSCVSLCKPHKSKIREKHDKPALYLLLVHCKLSCITISCNEIYFDIYMLFVLFLFVILW